jgi:8-amino-7-oxononanoate synthase
MPDLFARFKDFATELASAEGLVGFNPFHKPIRELDGTEAVMGGVRVIMIGSNNYLGLTTDPRVREAAMGAIHRYGTSCTGSRLLNGTLELHTELEARLARFVGKEAALIFGTGYQTTLGAVTTLLCEDDVAYCDKEVHASILDSVKMSGAEQRRFRHNDLDDLERHIKESDTQAPKMIFVDGVYSMGGDLALLPEVARLADRYDARIFLDDAHGLGVMGPRGRGTAMHLGCAERMDLIMGTFSKSFASLGGVIAGSREVIQFIQYHARPFLFSASVPPANLATVNACLDILDSEPERAERASQHAARVRRELTAMGYDCGKSVTPIVPVYLREQTKTVLLWKALFERGVYANPVLPPGVRHDQCLLRTSYMATHTDGQIDRVLSAFREAGLEQGVLS